MEKSISLTVPMDYNALTRASDMLHGLALDCKNGGELSEVETPLPRIDPDKEKQVDKINEENGLTPPAPAITETQEPAEVEQTETPPPAGVDLDGEGLPWDGRIHSANKTKLAKKPNGWKKKRGVDPALVETVEAELRAAMSAPAPTETTTEATPPTPTPATTDDAAAAFQEPAATTTPPTPPAETVEGITTFPAIMSAITAAMTANDITQNSVNDVLQKNGLASLPLLAARPDLIPTIATELGL